LLRKYRQLANERNWEQPLLGRHQTPPSPGPKKTSIPKQKKGGGKERTSQLIGYLNEISSDVCFADV